MERSGSSDDDARSSVDEFRAHLVRLLASDAFPASPRRRKLLAYVVTQTLAGRGEQLKAYDLAISVLGRDKSFDAQADPIVRIEMGRLRRDLDHYYANQGRAESTRIAIPKGHYRAVLERWPAAPAGAAISHDSTSTETLPAGDRSGTISALHGSILSHRPKILSRSRDANQTGMAQPAVVVQPFRNVGGGEVGQHLAVGLTEGLIADLMCFDCLDVFAGQPNQSGGEAVAGNNGDLWFRLDGIVERELDRLRVTARLSDGRSGQVLWTDRFNRLLPAVGLLRVTAELTAAIAGRLASPYGAIHQSALRQLDRAGFQDARLFGYASVQRAFRYRQTFSRNDYYKVRTDLELAVRREPDCAAAQAMLAFAHMEAARFGIVAPTTKGDELQAGLQSAQLAVELAPDSAARPAIPGGSPLYVGRDRRGRTRPASGYRAKPERSGGPGATQLALDGARKLRGRRLPDSAGNCPQRCRAGVVSHGNGAGGLSRR